MKKIVFLAPYPAENNIKEGMMQRVDAIDSLFSNADYQKTYVVPRFKSLKTTKTQVRFNVEEVYLSIWLSLYSLIKLVKQADIVYAHSLYGVSLAGFLFLPFLSKKNFIWDVHGIIPEEIGLAGCNRFKQYIYGLLEKAVAYRARKIVVVTTAMSNYLKGKYPWLNTNVLVYPILPITIVNKNRSVELESEVINLIYAGNMQGYQNIPLMAESIKRIANVPHLQFYILTGEKERMEKLFQQMGMGGRANIIIDSVDPSELDKYYRKAHYGYILRDDVNVNNVACPTKIIEYLAYGITCITKSNKIGDFEKMGFDYINVNQLELSCLKPYKSKMNMDIYNKILEFSNSDQFKSFIIDNYN